jgi:hypothetical protein
MYTLTTHRGMGKGSSSGSSGVPASARGPKLPCVRASCAAPTCGPGDAGGLQSAGGWVYLCMCVYACVGGGWVGGES